MKKKKKQTKSTSNNVAPYEYSNTIKSQSDTGFDDDTTPEEAALDIDSADKANEVIFSPFSAVTHGTDWQPMPKYIELIEDVKNSPVEIFDRISSFLKSAAVGQIFFIKGDNGLNLWQISIATLFVRMPRTKRNLRKIVIEFQPVQQATLKHETIVKRITVIMLPVLSKYFRWLQPRVSYYLNYYNSASTNLLRDCVSKAYVYTKFYSNLTSGKDIRILGGKFNFVDHFDNILAIGSIKFKLLFDWHFAFSQSLERIVKMLIKFYKPNKKLLSSFVLHYKPMKADVIDNLNYPINFFSDVFVDPFIDPRGLTTLVTSLIGHKGPLVPYKQWYRIRTRLAHERYIDDRPNKGKSIVLFYDMLNASDGETKREKTSSFNSTGIIGEKLQLFIKDWLVNHITKQAVGGKI